MGVNNKTRAIAIHLPQFHPIAENNEWWGKGFTEWTNVVKAKPLFEGHYQPHLPADLGFYDLRLEEARLAQEAMAKEYGIYGFCYYHYWFNGKRLLNEPIDRKLKNPKEDFPFMLCWANENWSRNWDGYDNDILMKQNYCEEDDLKHIQFLCKNIFSDDRYIKINGKPFFIFYRPTLFPDINKTIKLWRAEALRLGIGELYIGFMNSFGKEYNSKEYDIDAAIEFPPHLWIGEQLRGPLLNKLLLQSCEYINEILNKIGNKSISNLFYKIERNIKRKFYREFNENNIFDYSKTVEAHLNNEFLERTYPSLYPMWDNSSRKNGKNALIQLNSTPELYGKWLKSIIERFKPFSVEEDFIFINAWNEWAEGNHLEPCKKWGLKYLEITKELLNRG